MTDANQPDAAQQPEQRQKRSSELPVEEAGEISRRVIDNVETVIIGNPDSVEHLMTAILARGHVLIEDVPGVGKTMLARAVATSVECSFRRVQFTPDLLPSDVTGVNVFNQQTREFEFQPGPVFANIVLGDEINRAPPKTQSAFLEAMEEQQVTVDGDTRPVPDPFTVIATQNSVEPNRTYELPMAQVDRFMKKVSLGYPSHDEETRLLGEVAGEHPIESLESVATTEDLLKAQETTASIAVTNPIRDYATRLARYTRDHAQLGLSPRGTISLLAAAQARAVLNGREYVLPDDVQVEAPFVTAHRLRLDPNAARDEPRELVAEALENVPVK